MGATNFISVGKAETPDKAFDNLRTSAQYEHGHGGYTGTIAEKGSFVYFGDIPEGVSISELEDAISQAAGGYCEWVDGKLVDVQPDPTTLSRWFGHEAARIGRLWDDKWGPAVAFRRGDEYVFMGLASE